MLDNETQQFNPDDIHKAKYSIKFRVISIILFIASILSFFVAFLIIANISFANHLDTENMWIFYLFTPIPVSSIIFGYIAKGKGYKSIKNIVIGFIIAVLLTVYGSFTFIFASTYDYSDKPITKIENLIETDIPRHTLIKTKDWTKGSQSTQSGEYIYYISDIYFEEEAVEAFEKEIANDEIWLSKVPNSLHGITSFWGSSNAYDYSLIYNIDTDEFNCLPQKNGKYRFINVLYQSEENQMKILEYEIEFTK